LVKKICGVGILPAPDYKFLISQTYKKLYFFEIKSTALSAFICVHLRSIIY
jgi:hypothetical protein